MDFGIVLGDIVAELSEAPVVGRVASYIPELKRVDPNRLGMALRRVDGATFGAGDCAEPFSIQSMSKVLALALALELNSQAVWSRVGVEPSGDPFNSLVQLETEQGIPRNPLINSGALVVSDILVEALRDPKAEFLSFVRSLGGLEHLCYDDEVAQSELRVSDRNRALAYFMKSFGNIRSDVEEVLEFYVYACSLAMSCNDVVRVYAFLADHGTCVRAGKKILSKSQVRRINALMLTCGFYDEAGEFAFRVGLPGKSGVGGGIVAVLPEEFTVAAWSPRLGAKGNSALATLALRLLAERTNASVF